MINVEVDGVSAQKKAKPEKPAKETGESKVQLATIFEPTEDILKRLEREVKKGEVKYYTPYMLANQLNVKISVARKILKEAEKRGILKLYSGGRRTPIYIPASNNP
uniref:30S ribosomal protein S25e n=1 Tax=Thermosphaera aggregans TaxID=54254 RepID=A0A7C2BLN7_9CREN